MELHHLTALTQVNGALIVEGILSEEYVGQTEGQFVGSLKLNFNF